MDFFLLSFTFIPFSVGFGGKNQDLREEKPNAINCREDGCLFFFFLLFPGRGRRIRKTLKECNW